MSDVSGYVGTASQDTFSGTQSWGNFSNFTGNTPLTYTQAKVSDGVDVGASLEVWLMKNGVRSGNSKTIYPESKATDILGSSSDLWGASLTPSDVNNSNFGISIQGSDIGGYTTYYLNGSNFGFSIDTDTEIKGIEVSLVNEKYYSAILGTSVRCYMATIKVYYDDNAVENNVLFNFGGII